jgi:putative ABC transport system substrate-binding protein
MLRLCHAGRRARRWLGACLLALAATAAHADDGVVVWPRFGTVTVAPADGLQRVARVEAGSGTVADEPARRAAGSIAVVYPELGEPYRSIFNDIIEGIAEQSGQPPQRFPLTGDGNAAGLQAQLRRAGVRVVIALGRQGLRATAGLEQDIAVVVGGVVSVPVMDRREFAGVSLTPDPALLFDHMKKLMPGIRRVTVVYNPQNNEWLLNLARAAARTRGLELQALEARDLASAARLYQGAIVAADGRRDAIWLPQDATTVDENTILPLVLREAWDHSVPVFSSSFPHVRKGALFALYPDNRGLGRTLARTAAGIQAGENRQGMVPLQAVLTAVNLRTASHLGLKLEYQQQRRFDFVFPEPR